jgi:hypothetical protein
MTMLIPGKRLTVFSIKTTDRRGTVWVRIGTAFVNKDESLNLWLDALPLDGKLHCREAMPERQGATGTPPDDSAAAPAQASAGGVQ